MACSRSDAAVHTQPTGGRKPPELFQHKDMDAQHDLRQHALQLLSRREHSQVELRQKLGTENNAEALATLLDQLASDGLQSDERFAGILVRNRMSQGYGPLRIRQELRQKGIADEQIHRLLSADGIDWNHQARQVWQRRFRGRQERDSRQKAKQMRFLNQRGFSGEQIRYALSAQGEDEAG